MLNKDGTLFHIDFGHFLGNFKSKKIVGIEFKREKAPFVFTPQFCHILGGRESQTFNEFVEICQKAYNCIRKNAHLFISLFQMVFFLFSFLSNLFSIR